jgi:hypothetical protein
MRRREFLIVLGDGLNHGGQRLVADLVEFV